MARKLSNDISSSAAVSSGSSSGSGVVSTADFGSCMSCTAAHDVTTRGATVRRRTASRASDSTRRDATRSSGLQPTTECESRLFVASRAKRRKVRSKNYCDDRRKDGPELLQEKNSARRRTQSVGLETTVKTVEQLLGRAPFPRFLLLHVIMSPFHAIRVRNLVA